MNSRDPWRLIITDPYDGSVLYPRPHYGHPFYKEVPSWIHYGGDQSPYRELFEGVFVGADAGAAMPNNTTVVPSPVPPRKGLLADVAPIVAPGTGGFTMKKEFDERQVLHVEICVDGKCYRTSMDLAPAIEMLMQKLASWHQEQHAGDAAKLAQWHREQHASDAAKKELPPSTVVSTIENAIKAAGDQMAYTLVGRHIGVMTSGWLDDVGGAIGGTLRTLAPVISTVATGVATAYGGPAAGAAAGALVPQLTQLQANLLDPKGDPKKKAAAAQKAAQIKQQAAQDPALAAALRAANQAVKNTTIAYHVKDTAQKAASGDTSAQAQINDLVSAAEKGDPAAKSTFEILATTLGEKLMTSETGAKLWEQITGRGPGVVSGWYDIVSGTPIVGSFWDDVGNAVLTVTGTKATNQFIHDNHLEGIVGLAGQAVATYYGGPAAGAAAKALGPTIMSLGVEDKKKAQAAQADVHGVKAVAQQTDPQMAQAIDAAHGALAHTATAYQVAQISKDARAGVLPAQRAIDNLQAAAARGDRRAARALQAIAAIDREQQTAPGVMAGIVVGCQTASVGAGPWYDIVSG